MTENEMIHELNAPFEVLSSCTSPTKACRRAYSVIFEAVGGNAAISFDEGDILLKKGEICLIRPFVMFSVKEAKDSASEIRFDVHTLELPSPFISRIYRYFGELCGDDEPYHVFSDAELCRLTGKIRNCCGQDYFEVYPQLIQLLTAMCRDMKAAGTDMPLEHICEFIDVRSAEQTEASEAAAICGMSYPSFARKFHEHYGRSFKEHINYVRTVKARMLLLNTDMELAEIARNTGFFDCSHLIRTYRRHLGTTPNRDRISCKCK